MSSTVGGDAIVSLPGAQRRSLVVPNNNVNVTSPSSFYMTSQMTTPNSSMNASLLTEYSEHQRIADIIDLWVRLFFYARTHTHTRYSYIH